MLEREALSAKTHLAHKNEALSGRVRAAYSRLVTTRGHHAISLSHVRAHTRVAGNELVDRLAKAAAHDASLTGDGDLVAARAASEYADACAASPHDPLTADLPQTPPPVPPTSAPNPAAARGPPTPFSPPLAAHSLGVG